MGANDPPRPAPVPAGKQVRRISNPDAVGTIVSSSWDIQVGAWHYKVRFGTGARGVPASDLEPMPGDADLIDDLARGRYSNAATFRTLLTYERLRKPPSRVAASFGSAKAAFYPFQFTPLLKFLESPSQRILIADDVGLGKTIEAGYVLRELRARNALQRILIVVPAQLRSKWRLELERRFSETFEIVAGRDLADLRGALQRGRELEPFRWITSYEAVRARANIDLFDEFKPPIDLVIFDEAHRMRNPATLQARFGRVLADCVDSLLLLTATPVQTKVDDLFWLLHLLEPERFSSPELFVGQSEANRPVVRALARIRGGAGELPAVREELESLAHNPLTADLAGEPFFQEILRRLRPKGEVSRRELVALQREIAELSLTGSVVSRTRKVDVYPDRQPRRPQTHLIPLSEVEREVYQGIGHLFRLYRSDLQEQGLRLALTTLFRMAGSCLPAAAGRFESFVSDRIAIAELAGEFDSGDETGERLEGQGELEAGELLQDLQQLLRDYRAGVLGDSKLESFLRAVETVWDDDRQAGRDPRKIVVFSTFIATLRYLARSLEARSIAYAAIDGRIPVREREAILERFQNDEIPILLSSEVGSEGIDLQFASVVVNYDLPWNPMVVEQRIGRLDRIGQSSPIVVVSLVLGETIEERIVHRLLDRVGVFRETIGELEPILGEETVEELMIEALSGALTPEEELRKADAAAEALLQQEAAAQRVRKEADRLLAADQAFLDEIEGLAGGRRIPDGRELLAFLRGVLQAHFPGCDAPLELAVGVARLRVTAPVRMELRKLPPDAEITRVAGLLEGGEFRCTFDQGVALRHPRADLVHARHPLLRFALEWMRGRREEAFRGFHLMLPSDSVPPGLYAFGICFLELFGGRPRTEIRTVVVPLGAREPLPEETVDRLFAELLDRGEDPQLPLGFSEVALRASLERVRELAELERQRLLQSESALNAARTARRRTTVENTHRSRVEGAEQRLRALQSKGAPEFPLRMARRRLEKVRAEYTSAMEEMDIEEKLRVEDEEVALGLLSVRRAS